MTIPPTLLDEQVPLRAQLLKVYKSLASLLRMELSEPQRIMAERMRADMLTIMPELAEIHGWPVVGSRHKPNDLSARDLSPISTAGFPAEFIFTESY